MDIAIDNPDALLQQAAPVLSPLDQFKEEEKADLFEFPKFASKLKSMASDWSQEKTKSDTRRQLRLVEIDVDAMRESEECQQDETFIPIRLIHENIATEKPEYVSFLTQANKLISFTDKLSPAGTDTALLENEFTKGMKYHGWELPWYREFDGTQLHGWDAVEVVYDSTKPLNVGIEHIGHDRLLFHMDIQDIQNAPFVIRVYTMTSVELKRMVIRNGWSAEQVRLLLESKRKTSKEEGELIYKVFFKFEGQVFVGWLNLTVTTDWLVPPVPFYNGVRKKQVITEMVQQMTQQTDINGNAFPVTSMVPQQKEQWNNENEDMYPIFLLRYDETENLPITACKGRAFLDCHKQEAHTAIVTGFVNALTRASNVYASVENPDGSGILKYESDVALTPGRIMTNPLKFFHTDYPDAASTLGALQYLDNQNINSMGKKTEALRSKKGEKTKFEFETAQQDETLLSSVQLTLLSGHVREVYSYVWRIVQSQALQGLVPLLVQNLNDDGTGNVQYINDNVLLEKTYDIRAAGDIEVIQKGQQIDRRKQDWPVISQTPLAMVFLIDLLKREYPEDALRYEKLLQQGDAGKQLVVAFRELVGSLLQKYPQELAEAPPEVQQQIAQLEQQAAAYLGEQAAPAQQ